MYGVQLEIKNSNNQTFLNTNLNQDNKISIKESFIAGEKYKIIFHHNNFGSKTLDKDIVFYNKGEQFNLGDLHINNN